MQAPAQGPVVVNDPHVDNNKAPNFKGHVAIGLGITQIIIGILVVIFEAVAISYEAFASISMTGVWTGIIFIVNGIIGIRAGVTKNRCVVTAFMVMSIICAVLGAGLLIYGVIGLIVQGVAGWSGGDHTRNHTSREQIIYGLTGAMIVWGVLELTIAIVSSAFCCAGICGQQNKPMQVTYVSQGCASYPAADSGPQVSMYQQQGQPVAVASTQYDTKYGPPLN